MITRTLIPDVLLIKAKRHVDERGWFSETFNRKFMREHGFPDFVQENESLSRMVGTVRGLHFQRSPAAQAKLVRCVQGAIFDVALDLRKTSETFGQHVAIEMSANGGEQLYIPTGFAHGFCTLTAETLVQYKVSAHYAPSLESGVRWNDAALEIDWPACADPSTLSSRDRAHLDWTGVDLSEV